MSDQAFKIAIERLESSMQVRAQYRDQLQAILRMQDRGFCSIEAAHACVDSVLCDLLRDLGYEEVVDLYRQIPKWYA